MEEFFFLLFFAPIYTYIIVSREGTCQHIAAAKKNLLLLCMALIPGLTMRQVYNYSCVLSKREQYKSNVIFFWIMCMISYILV